MAVKYNTDGSFTTAALYSFLSPYEKFHRLQVWDNLVCFIFYIENCILCVHIRIAKRGDSNENTQHTFIL